MNVNDFYEYLANPQLLNKATLDELNEVIERYPYFQLARMLYLKNLYLLNDDRYQQTLEKYSIYFFDRKSLFDFIHDTEKPDEPLQTEVITELPSSQNEELVNTTPEIFETPPTNQPTVIESPSTTEIELQSTINIEEEINEDINKVIDNIQETQQTESTENKPTQQNISIADLILQKIESQKKALETNNQEKQTTGEKIIDQNTESASTDNAFTFQDWLDRLSTTETIQNKPQNNASDNLIDNFLQNIDQIERIKPPQEPSTENEDLTENLLPPEELDFVSEQLAQIYYKQGYLEKALKMYEKLFLKYPEKSIYFAGLIQEIKQKLDKN